MVLCNERMKEREKMMVTSCVRWSMGSVGPQQRKKVSLHRPFLGLG